MALTDNTTVTAPQPDQQPTQSAPIAGQLTSPPAAPPQQQAPPAPQQVQAKPGQTFHNMSHAFLGAVLGTLAGAPTTKYTTDNDPASPTYGRQSADPKQPTDSVSDRLKRIASNALMGLAAGSQVDQKKSGAADALAGAGAGFGAVTQQKLTQDATSREKETENFKQQQAAKLQQMEIARGNALTMSTYYANMKQGNDMTPEFAENQSIYDAAKDSPEFSGRVAEMNWDQVQNEVKTDPSTASHPGFMMTHKVLPLGIAPATDDEGKPVLNPDGTPQTHMRFAVINGVDNGNIEVSPQLAASVAEYGPMGGIPNAGDIKAGQTLTKQQLMPLLNAIGIQRKNVLEGWHQSKLGYTPDEKGEPDYSKPVEINSYDKSRTRPMGPGVIPAEAAAAESEEGVKAGHTALEKAQAQEQIDAGKEHLATAAMLTGGLVGTTGDAIHQAVLSDPKIQGAIAALPKVAQTVLNSLPPVNLPALMTVANGDAKLTDVFPARPIKGTGVISSQQALGLVHLFNPDWNEEMVGNKQKALNELAPGAKTGDAIASFGNFFNHAAELKKVSEEFQRTNSQLLNQGLNELKRQTGNPEAQRLATAITAVQDEWMNFIKSGKAPFGPEAEQTKTLMSEKSNAATILGVSQVMGEQGIGRLDNINEGFRRSWHQDIPNLIPPEVRDSINTLGLGRLVQDKYNTGGNIPGTPNQPAQNPQSGQSGPPQGATHQVPGPDGKMHYTNAQGTVDLGVVQ